MTSEENTSAPYATQEQDAWHATVNDQVRQLGYVGVVQSKSVSNSNSLSPNNGQWWLVASSGTNDFLGHDGELAGYYDGWLFRPLKNGAVFTVLDTGSGGSGKSVWFNDAGSYIKLHDP